MACCCIIPWTKNGLFHVLVYTLLLQFYNKMVWKVVSAEQPSLVGALHCALCINNECSLVACRPKLVRFCEPSHDTNDDRRIDVSRLHYFI